MDIVRTYGNMVREQLASSQARAAAMVRLGLHAESFRTKHLADKRIPRALRYLNHMSIKTVADALSKPSAFVWANLFAPVEIPQSFGLSCVSVETLASYLSGFWIEDTLNDLADSAGFASTLCSYHRCFLGACEAGLAPVPAGALTTSMICDGNISTFRYLQGKYGLPTTMVDVPNEWSPEAQRYVVAQLKELIAQLELVTGKPYDEDRLKAVLERENRSKDYYLEFLEKRKDHDYPATLSLNLFMLLASHLAIGSEWALEFYRQLAEDVEQYPPARARRLFWVHLTPYSEPALAEYLNFSSELSVITTDFDLDYLMPLDVDRPLEALARKMIGNVFNGGFDRKVQLIANAIEEYKCEGAVEFCHWGCRQSAGGAQLLRTELRKRGIPMLVLDGDGVDRRSNQDGQIRTRFEAFLEVLNQAAGRQDSADASADNPAGGAADAQAGSSASEAADNNRAAR